MARIIRAAPNTSDIPAGFPILIDESMRIIEPVFSYLLHLATIPGRTRSPQTTRTYAEHLLDWFDTLEQSNIAWNEIETGTLASYRNRHLAQVSQRTERPYSLSTINDRLRAVCRFYAWAHKGGWIDHLPFNVVSVAVSREYQPFLVHTQHNPNQVTANELTLREHEKVRRALPLSEIHRLMPQLTQPYQLMAEWALATGMRPMEICALTLYQIPESISLRRRDHPIFPISLTITKGNKPRDVHAPIQLLDRTHHYIDEVREQVIRAQRKHDSSYVPGDSLFLGIRGQEINPKRMSAAFKKAFRAAGIQSNLYCLRHTFAIRTLKALTERQKNGENINPMLYLRIILGHASITTTEIYLRSLQLEPEKIADDITYLYGEVIDYEDTRETISDDIAHLYSKTIDYEDARLRITP